MTLKDPAELIRELDDKQKPSDEELPPITVLELDVEGTRGRRYRDQFHFKVPTLADQIMIGKLKNQYLPEGGAADINATALVEQICYLEVTLQKPRPDWWEPFAFYDATPIAALYKEALAYERKFHGEHDDNQPDSEGAGSTERPDDGGAVHEADKAPVGRKVRAAAKRRETIIAHGEGSG
jgi:hypothetical protein